VRKQFVAGPVVILTLVGLLVWRLRADKAQSNAPPGGSATIEGVETIVSSKLASRITDVLVEEGDRVKRGQVVVKLDCTDQEAILESLKTRVRAAEAQVAVAEASVKSTAATAAVSRAQIDVALAQTKVLSVEQEMSLRDKARAEELGKTGAISAVEIERTSTKLQTLEEQQRAAAASVHTAKMLSSAASTSILTARAQIEAGRAAVESAIAEQRRAEIQIAECNLVAPRDGVITARLLEPGAVVVPGSRVLTVLDISTAKVTFFLPNAELGRASLDAPADVRVDAFPGKVFSGKVRRVASEAEFTPRNVQTREDRDRLVYAVEIHVDNQEGLLRAGMPAEVVLLGAAQ
jgi:HlyD family secretion protein